MASDFYTIQLEAYDDAVTIRDRLAFVESDRVVLMWPPATPVLRRKLDLLLVQRRSSQLGLWLALITDDPQVLDHAVDLNISVFPDEQSAANGHWKRPRDKVFLPPRDPADDIAEQILFRRLPRPVGAVRRETLTRWGLFAAALGLFALAFLLAVPSASVTITPANRQVYETVSIVAQPGLPDIDIEHKRMPSTVVTIQATSHVTIQTSGKETAGATLAQGLVTFTNAGDDPILIPLGTIVATSATFPVRFETLIETTLPGGNAAVLQVPIQALPEHAGAAGNVPASAINRVEADFADDVTVTNRNATYGGATQERRTVTADDHERLLILSRQQVLQNARDELLHFLSGEQFLVPGSVAIMAERPEWTIYSAVIGDVADSVSLDLRAEVQAVVVDENLAQEVAYSALAPYVQPGLEISQGALEYARGDIRSIDPDGTVTFLMIVKGNIAVAVDAERVRDRMTGVSVDEAYRRLESELLLDPNRPPAISTWPGWFGRMPLLGLRITVTVNAP